MKDSHGVTLMELMVCLLIVAILYAIVYPNYGHFVRQGRRLDAMNNLLSYQMLQEKHRANNLQYAADFKVLAGAGEKKVMSANGYYQLSIGKVSASAYELFAEPKGKQKQDKDCGTFALNQNGPDFSEGYASLSCWNL